MGRSRYNSNSQKNSQFIGAAYIRLSQEDGDKEESNSVTSQREIIDYYLKNESGIELYDYYIDDGFTGTDFKRPSFQRMLEDLENKKINTIIVKDLSRFGRNYIEVGNFIEQVFPTYKTRFIAISDKIDNFKNPESLNSMIFPFKNMINEEYCRDISRKIRSAKMARVKKGDFMQGHAPYGYVKNPNDKYRFLIDEEAAKVIRLIFKMFLENNGYGTISNYLNDNNYLCPSRYKCEVQNIKYRSPTCTDDNINEKRWTIIAVKRILTNQVYCGDQIQCKQRVLSHKNHKAVRTQKEEWVIVENTHEAIISREDFNKVQKIIDNKTYPSNKRMQVNYYAGHLYCKECGRFMLRKYTGRRKSNPNILNYTYYCSTRYRICKDDCIENKIKSEDLDKIVLKAIKHQIKLYLKVDTLIDEIIEKLLQISNIEASITRIDKLLDIASNLAILGYNIYTFRDYLNELIEKRNSSNTKTTLDNIERKLNEKRKIKQKFYEDWKLGIISKEDYLNFVKSNENTINILTERYKKYSDKLREENNLEDKKSLFKKIEKYKDIKEINKELIDDMIDKIYSYGNNKVEIIFKYQDEYKNIMKLIKQIKK